MFMFFSFVVSVLATAGLVRLGMWMPQVATDPNGIFFMTLLWLAVMPTFATLFTDHLGLPRGARTIKPLITASMMLSGVMLLHLANHINGPNPIIHGGPAQVWPAMSQFMLIFGGSIWLRMQLAKAKPEELVMVYG